VAGYVPVEDALFHYHEAKFRNMRPSRHWAGIRGRLKEQGSKGSLEWGLRLEDSKLHLYKVVRDGEIRLFAWPAEIIDKKLVIQTTADGPAVVPVHLVEQLFPIHGGLPESTLGLSPTMVYGPAEGEQPRVERYPDALPVFSEREFIRWLARERAKGGWPSQEAFLSHSGTRRRRKSDLAKPLIRDAVESKAWACFEPIAQLARLVRAGFKDRGWGNVSNDVVAAALDELYIATADPALWTRGFGLRNPELRGFDEPTQRLKTPIPPCTSVKNFRTNFAEKTQLFDR
jgi:hypothetical protein